MDKNALDKYNGVEYVVNNFAENEELLMSIVKEEAEYDSLYVEVRITNGMSINMIKEKPDSWYDFINEVIPVPDLKDRAEEVKEDLIDIYEKESIARMEDELEIELTDGYKSWYEENHDEEPDDNFSIRVEIDISYNNIDAEELILERKLIRGNS